MTKTYLLIAALLIFVISAKAYTVTITPSANGTVTIGNTTQNASATVTVTVTPDDGYYITASNITITPTGNGDIAQTRTPDIATPFHPEAGSIDPEGKGSFTFTMPTSNARIEAVFIPRTLVSGAIVNLNQTTFIYNGNIQQPTVTSVKNSDETVTFADSESTNGYADYDISIPNSVTATESPYTVSITFRGKYTGSATADYTINPQSLDGATLNSIISLSSTSLSYTGNAQAPTVTIEGMVEGSDFSVKYKKGEEEATSEKPKDVGEYTIVVIGKDNYSGEVVTYISFNIVKVTATVKKAPIGKTLTYNGSKQKLIEEGTTEEGTMFYSLDNTTYDTAIPEEKDVKEYTIYYKVVGDGNHLDSEPAKVIANITTATLDITAENKSKTYGDKDPELTYTIKGLNENDKADEVMTGKLEREEGENVGTYAIKQGTLAVSANYSIAFHEATLTIGKRDIKVSGITAENKTYDGNTKATLNYTGVVYDGIIDGDELTITAKGSFTDEKAGTGKTVYITELTLGGESVANYQLATTGQQESTTADIIATIVLTKPVATQIEVKDNKAIYRITFDKDATLHYILGTDEEKNGGSSGVFDLTISKSEHLKAWTEADGLKSEILETTLYAPTPVHNTTGTFNFLELTEEIDFDLPVFVDKQKPISVDGELLYMPNALSATYFDDHYAFPEDADTRFAFKKNKGLEISQGSNTYLAILGLNKKQTVVCTFSGNMHFVDGSKVRLISSKEKTRTSHETEIISETEYEVLEDCNLLIKLITETAPVTISEIIISSNSTTGIEITKEFPNDIDGYWFNMNGQKLTDKPTRKGIYIYRGQKIFVH